MIMSREKEPVMQLYTEFKSFFSFFFKKKETNLKKEKIALSFTIPLEIKPSKINNNNNNNHSSSQHNIFTTESRG